MSIEALPVRHAVGIDVGGTSIKAVRLRADGLILERRQVDLPATESEILARIAALTDELAAGAKIGVCVPGIVDEHTGIAHVASNLPWRMSPLRELLAAGTGREVRLGHDVRCGARAELRWGAAVRDTLYVAIGTGISSVSLVGGNILPGLHAGEIGQVLVSMPGRPTTRVPMESVSSAASIARRFAEASPGVLADRAGAREVVARVADDPVAARVVAEALATLADVLSVAVAVTAPAIVVVAGGLAEGGPVILDPLVRNLNDALALIVAPPVVASALGQFGQAMGAAALALDAR